MLNKIKNIFKSEEQTVSKEFDFGISSKIAQDIEDELIKTYSSIGSTTVNTQTLTSNLSSANMASIINGAPGSSFGSFTYTTTAATQRLVFGGMYDKFVFRINDSKGAEIVSMMNDGSIIWSDTVDINEAAVAMTTVFSLSAEKAVGITNNIKLKMRDSVFQDIINIAKEKGPLSAEELTYLLEASKIVEKLKAKE